MTLRPFAARLRPPRPALSLVRRAALLDELAAGKAPLTLVSAPAGSGKTCLLLEWFDEWPAAKAWLSLDEDCDDPVVLLTYLALALDEVCEVDPQVLTWLHLPAPPVAEAILPALADALAGAGPFLFVLDDAQRLSAPMCWALLAGLFEALPGGARVAIGTRHDPDLPLGRLRVRGELAELRFADLALDAGEARELLVAHGQPTDEQTVTLLLAVTEGWAAGLYLAALSQFGAKGAGGQLHGDSREIGRYLTAEVLDRQPEAVRRFLLETSILERLCPDLCRDVTGKGEAGELLARLTAENLFLSALDERQWWYRYHHLFAEYLQAELQRRAPAKVAGLHARAARWFEQDGDVEAATRHWLAAGEVDRAADVVCRCATAYTFAGRMLSVERWLELFSDEQIRGQVTLCLLAGWLYTTSGRAPRDDEHLGRLWASSEVACRADETAFPDGRATLHGWRSGIRGMAGGGGLTTMLADLKLAASPEHAFDPSWRAGFEALHGTACWLTGQDAQAQEILRHAAAEGELCNPLAEMGAWCALSLLAATRGRWQEAAAQAERSVRRMQEADLALTPQASCVFLARALVLSHAGDPAALEPATAAADVYAQTTLWPWLAATLSTFLTEVYLDLGDITEAERWAAAADTVLKTWPDAGILPGRLRHSQARLLERRGVEPLTEAETRVLALLQAQLTNEEIAGRLFVSPNTVKTHLRAINRKLGATSRRRAVQRARELGLLPL